MKRFPSLRSHPAVSMLLGLVLAAPFAASVPAAAAAPPGYEEPATWVGPVYFSWFRNDGRGQPVGQYYSPWVPLEGRRKWDGSVKFHKRHIRHIAKAGFNMIFAVHTFGYEEQETNLFKAIRARKARGLHVPKVAPYFAAGSFECRECPKRFGGRRDRNLFYQRVARWYRRFFRVLEPEDLAFYDGRVLTGVWWVPGAETADNRFFARVNRQLETDFGLEAFWSVNFTWETADYDELNFTFASLDGLTANEQGSLDLLTGFWPPGIQPRENFLAREGGDTYESAWSTALRRTSPDGCSAPRRITIVSYNELTEGSGIYPAKCVRHFPNDGHWSGEPNFDRCGNQPCHPHQKEDRWAKSCGGAAPKLYLNISRKMIRELERVNRQRRFDCQP